MRRCPARLLAVAVLVAGPLGVASPVASAATHLGPSERSCAKAFDAPENAAVRARVQGSHVLNVQIFATAIPTCVVKFQLPAERVLIAEVAWTRGIAATWHVTLRAHGRVAGRNGRWANGRLTATAPDAARVVSIGPPPTMLGCLRAWNSEHPARAASLAPAPVFVAPLAANVYGMTVGGQNWVARAPGCTVLVRTTLFFAPWNDGRAVGWTSPPGVTGVLGAGLPNADLAASGRLTVR
jgi:hypothetical protein